MPDNLAEASLGHREWNPVDQSKSHLTVGQIRWAFEWLTVPCEELSQLYVCFSHRPVDVHNVYNQVQVKMLMKEDDCENIPAFEDVFRDDEEEQEEEGVSFVVIFKRLTVR